MKQVKTALTTLEQAILKLETAIFEARKTQARLTEQMAELKQVLQTTCTRLDTAIETYRKEIE